MVYYAVRRITCRLFKYIHEYHNINSYEDIEYIDIDNGEDWPEDLFHRFMLQCFKAAGLVLWPFGKEVNYGGGMGSFLVNILWIFFGGMELAFVHLVIGGIYCITVVGIPFELQHFKLAKLALMPFGASVS